MAATHAQPWERNLTFSPRVIIHIYLSHLSFGSSRQLSQKILR